MKKNTFGTIAVGISTIILVYGASLLIMYGATYFISSAIGAHIECMTVAFDLTCAVWCVACFVKLIMAIFVQK